VQWSSLIAAVSVELSGRQLVPRCDDVIASRLVLQSGSQRDGACERGTLLREAIRVHRVCITF
jgi:hypothetical protein